MLEYLVTSKARRRLLALLWGEGARGSAAELAELTDVSVSNVHGELKEMERLQLVTVERAGRKEVFAANVSHPDADLLRALVASERSIAPPREGDDVVKRSLVTLGAPLRGVAPRPVASDERLAVLARGVELARRDPTVARALPICVWELRDALDVKELMQLVGGAEEKHALGFFLELAAELGGDRRLVGLAAPLRDRRMTSVRDFFQTAGPRHGANREFPLAATWGFRMNMDLASFRALFDKFVRT